MRVIFKKFSYISFIVFLTFIHLEKSYSAPIVDNLPKTCLPEASRMSRDMSAPCHCPPQTMCSEQITYNGQRTNRLPNSIYDICCSVPSPPAVINPTNTINNECDVQYYQSTDSFCADITNITARVARHCSTYTTASPTYTASVTALNACLLNTCQPLHQRILSYGGPNNRTSFSPRDFGRWKYELTGQIYYKDYLACRSNCFRANGLNNLITAEETELKSWVDLNLNSMVTDTQSLTLNRLPQWNDNVAGDNLSGKIFYGSNVTTLNQRFLTRWWNNTYPANSMGHPFTPLTRISNYEQQLDNLRSGRRVFTDFFRNNNFAPLNSLLVNTGRTYQFISPIPDITCGVTPDSYKDVSTCVTSFTSDWSCGSCIKAETEILLSDGSSKQIMHLKKGDKVKSSYDKVATIAKVVRKEWPELVLYSINDGLLELTSDHPIMTKKGWKAINYEDVDKKAYKRYGLQQVASLKVGDFIETSKGFIEVKSIKQNAVIKNGITFNLKLEKPNNSFYANGIIVKSHK